MHHQVLSYLEVGRKDGGWAALGSPMPWCWVEVAVGAEGIEARGGARGVAELRKGC